MPCWILHPLTIAQTLAAVLVYQTNSLETPGIDTVLAI
jgi:hypothetical protein